MTEQTSYHETEGIAASKRRMAAHENTAIQTVHGIDLTFENALRAATDRNRNAIRGGIHVPRNILLHLVAQQRLLQFGLVKPDDNRLKDPQQRLVKRRVDNLSDTGAIAMV